MGRKLLEAKEIKYFFMISAMTFKKKFYTNFQSFFRFEDQLLCLSSMKETINKTKTKSKQFTEGYSG